MAILTLTINYPCIFSGPWIAFPRWRSGINFVGGWTTINSLVCKIQRNSLSTMDKSSSNGNSPNSVGSEKEAIYEKPVRAAAAKAMRTLTFKDKGKGSSSGDVSKSSSKSWGSTKSGRRQLAKSSSEEPEEEIIIGPRPRRRSPRKACTAQGDNSGYPRLGNLQSPIKRPSTTQAPSGLFKRKPGRPKGAKNKNRGGSISDPGSRASKGGK